MSNYAKTVANSLSQKLGEIPSIIDFDCPIDGTSDCSLAINTAIVQVCITGGGCLKVPGGYTFTINNPILFTTAISGTISSTGTKSHTITSGSLDTTGRLVRSLIHVSGVDYVIDTIIDSTHLTTTEVIPSGSFSFSIAGQHNITLIGDDSASSHIKRGADMLDSSGLPTVGMVNIHSPNVSIKNINFDGSVTSATGVNYSTLAISTPTAYDPMQDILVKNSTIWIKGDLSTKNTVIENCSIFNTGGYAILIDARSSDVTNTQIRNCVFFNNFPHLFGTNNADLSYGSWTGGIHYQCDGTTNKVDGLLITGCNFSNTSGNQIWGHGYAYTTMNSNVTVTGNTFTDIGRDCIELGNTTGGLVEHNNGRRIGYITSSNGGTPTPKWLANQYAVFIDTTGVTNAIYNANTCVSVYGAFFDGDGFAYGSITNNVCRQPVSGDPEYTEDSISSWSDNYAYGVQIANNYFHPGGTNVNITGNSFINCKQGGIRLFSSRGCHVADNIISHPVTFGYPPIILGNFLPADLSAQTDTYNTDIVNNNIQWSPVTAQAAIQELENWGAGSILWSSGEKNWIADNKLFGNCFEFMKAPSSSSVTGTLLSSQADSITTTGHALISRKQSGGVNYTSFADASGNETLKYDDTGSTTLTSPSSDAFHHVSGVSGKNKGMTVSTSNSLRWVIGANSTSESGSNAGSDFSINRYDDSGSLIDTPFLINRSTGVVTAGTVATVTKFFDSFADVSTGTCTIVGSGTTTAVTWVSGLTFTSDMVGLSFTVNGKYTTISSFTDSHHITLGDNIGTVASPISFYIGNAFQTSTGTIQITAGGFGLFQQVVASGVFNSRADILGGNAFQTSTGNCYIDGTGKAAFQNLSLTSVAAGRIPFSDSTGAIVGNSNLTWDNTNKVLAVSGTAGSSGITAILFNATATGTGLAFQGSNFSVTGEGKVATNGYLDLGTITATVPTAAAGHAFIYLSGGNLMASVNGSTAVNLLSGGTVPGLNTQVIYNTSGVLAGNANFTFASNTLTVGSGVGTGVVAPTFNSNVTGTSSAFQVSSGYSWNGQGDIGVRSLSLGNQGSSLTGGSGIAMLSATSSALYVSLNGGTPINLTSPSITVPGSNTQVIFNNSGALGASSSFTWNGTYVAAPLFASTTTTGSGLAFQAGTNFEVDGNGNITSNAAVVSKYHVFSNTTAPSQGSGFAYLYSDVSGLNLAIGTGSFSRIATQSWVTSQGYITSSSGISGVKTSDGASYSNSGGYAILSFINSSGAITCGAVQCSGGTINATNYEVGGTLGFSGTGNYTHFTIVSGIITSAS